MSNLERNPHETPCTGAPVGTLEPTLRVLEPRSVPLGGPRAMLVRRTLPHRSLPSVGAWCFVDDYGPAVVAGTEGMHVPPHPHTGLQTVTWLLEGEVLHQDSVGSELLVRPGELNLMTAGRGIAHAETSPTVHTDVLRGVQLWIALPDAQRGTDPHFEHHADLPQLADGDLRATVLLGSVAGATSRATTYSPVVGADVELVAAGQALLPLEPGFEHALLPLTAGLEVDGAAVEAGQLVYLGCGRHDVQLAALGLPASSPVRLLLLGGTPFEEELLMWWNFVGRTHEEIEEARTEWEATRVDGGSRFGLVTGYDGAALPAPTLPTTRLKPRPRR